MRKSRPSGWRATAIDCMPVALGASPLICSQDDQARPNSVAGAAICHLVQTCPSSSRANTWRSPVSLAPAAIERSRCPLRPSGDQLLQGITDGFTCQRCHASPLELIPKISSRPSLFRATSLAVSGPRKELKSENWLAFGLVCQRSQTDSTLFTQSTLPVLNTSIWPYEMRSAVKQGSCFIPAE